MPGGYWRPKVWSRHAPTFEFGAAAITGRANVTGVGTLVGSSQGILRAGLYGADGELGTGPEGVVGTNVFRAAQWSPFSEGLSNLKGPLDLAEQYDQLLVVSVAGSSRNYGGGDNNANVGPPRTYDPVAYQAQLTALKNAPNGQGARLTQWFADRRAVAYFGDEPNAATWDQGSGQTGYNAVQWNGSARMVKDTFGQQTLTFGRLTPFFHEQGWYSGFHLPTPGGYDAIDYGWLQYNAVYRKAGTPVAQAINDEQAIGLHAGLQMGLGFSLNLVNAGYRTNLGGVQACWDYNFNGASNGVVVGSGGSDTPTGAPATTDGQKIPCSSITGTTGGVGQNRNLLVNPDLIRAAATAAAADADVPFMFIWTVPGPGAPSESDPLIPYWDRPDWVQARTDMRTIGLGRASNVGGVGWTGWRTAKTRPVAGWPVQS